MDREPKSRVVGGTFIIAFPLRENLRRNFTSPNQLVQIAENGPAGDPKSARQCRDIGTLGRISHELTDFALATQAVRGPAEEFLRIDPFGSLQRLELAHDLGFATLL